MSYSWRSRKPSPGRRVWFCLRTRRAYRHVGAAGSKDDTLKLWDATDGRLCGLLCHGLVEASALAAHQIDPAVGAERRHLAASSLLPVRACDAPRPLGRDLHHRIQFIGSPANALAALQQHRRPALFAIEVGRLEVIKLGTRGS